MCHPSVIGYVESVLSAEEIYGSDVVEVGSLDMNGSVRPTLEAHLPASYVGIDIRPGPRVDVICDAINLVRCLGVGMADVVISTEMLEHAQDWRTCLQNMLQVLRPGGLLVLTTRAPGFPYHPFPDDYWRFTPSDLARVLAAARVECLDVRPDPADPGVFCKARRPIGWVWPEHRSPQHVWPFDVEPVNH